MDIERTFADIGTHISKKEYDKVRPMIDTIVSSVTDMQTLLKCASLLKVVDDEEGCQRILNDIAKKDHGTAEERFAAASALRSLGRPADGHAIIKDDAGERFVRERSKMLLMMRKGNDALSEIKKITAMAADDKILLTEILCSTENYKDAYEVASQLAKDENASYDSLVNLCNTLILMGKNKDAVKTARQYLKEDKKDADSLALAAYVMRINGKMSSAAAFAHRAIAADHTHKGALETMAFCLIERSRFIEAKVMAGAINDKHPGDPAVIRILDACRIAGGGR